MSLPTRERGLKSPIYFLAAGNRRVAPYTGAWIEINHRYLMYPLETVAPYTGAWIEIMIDEW